MKILSKDKGVTLIELTIVLVIIGILVGIGAALVGPLTKKIKRVDTREIVKAAKEAVLGFAVTNKRLPTTAEFPTYVKNLDAWGNTLYYYVEPAFTSGNICNSSSTGFIVNDEGTAKSEIAFIILSMGDNGTRNTADTSPPLTYTILEQDVNSYDDIPSYTSISELKYNVLACTALEIKTTTLPPAIEDTFYTVTLVSGGGTSPTWSLVSGSGLLPNYLALSLGGVVSGTTDTSNPGETGSIRECSQLFPFYVRLSDTGMNPVTKQLSILVNPQALTITTTTMPDGRKGSAYSTTLAGTGGALGQAYTWSVLSGSLPPGLTLSSGGVISGTPTTVGTYSFTIKLTAKDTSNNTCSTTTEAFTLNILDTCSSTGISILNSTGSDHRAKRSGGACLYLSIGRTLTIQQGDILNLFTSSGCNWNNDGQCKLDGPTGNGNLTYDFFKGIDADGDCVVNWTVSATNNCTFTDY